jgi:hypothetical protein
MNEWIKPAKSISNRIESISLKNLPLETEWLLLESALILQIVLILNGSKNAITKIENTWVCQARKLTIRRFYFSVSFGIQVKWVFKPLIQN